MGLARLVLVIGPAAAVLAACAPREAAHDVAYYRGHSAERAAKLAACRGDPGRLQARSNCVNALAADAEAESRRFWSIQKSAPRVAAAGAL